jgi:hypothetical protein
LLVWLEEIALRLVGALWRVSRVWCVEILRRILKTAIVHVRVHLLVRLEEVVLIGVGVSWLLLLVRRTKVLWLISVSSVIVRERILCVWGKEILVRLVRVKLLVRCRKSTESTILVIGRSIEDLARVRLLVWSGELVLLVPLVAVLVHVVQVAHTDIVKLGKGRA